MADDVAALGFAIDSGPLKEGADQLRNFEAVAKRTGETVQQVQTRFTALADSRKKESEAAKTATTITAAAGAAHAKASEEVRKHNEQSMVARRIWGEMSNQAGQLAGSLGRVSGFLTALGPGGLVMAAGLGAAALGIKEIADASLALADRAGKMRDFADSTELTVVQIQALTKAGEETGLSAEQVTKAMERFSISMADVHEATGPVFDAIREIDPVLAQQMARTKTLAEAWDLYSQALRRADVEERNKLSRAATGRDVGIARLGVSTAEAGGIQGLVAGMNQIDVMTKQQIEHWDDLGDKIAANTKKARDNVVSTFATPTLEALEKVTASILELSRIFKSTDWSSSEFQTFWNWFTTAVTAATPGLAALESALRLASDAKRKFNDVMNPAQFPGGQGPNAQEARFQTAFNDVAAMTRQQQEQNEIRIVNDLTNAFKDNADEIKRRANASRESIAALGEAATFQEVYADKIKQLNVLLVQHKATTDEVARATRSLGLARDQSIEQVKEQAGVATQEEILLSRRAKLYADLEKAGIKSAENIAQAEKILVKESRETFEQIQIRASNFPGLKALEFEFGNLNKMIDQFAVSSVNQIASGLTDITMGTKTASEGFRDLGLVVLRSLEEMIIKVGIILPMMKALMSTMSLETAAPLNLLSFIGVGSKHSGGMVGMDGGGSTRYVNPAVFLGAPHFSTGGVVGGEIPIIAHRGEGVFTEGQMKALGKNTEAVSVIQNNTFHGSDPASEARLRVALAKTKEQAVKEAVAAVAKRRIDHPGG